MGTGGTTDRGTQQFGAVVTGVSCFLSRRADFVTSLHFNRGNYCNRFPFVFLQFLYSLSSFLSPFLASPEAGDSGEAPHRLVQLRT